MKNIPFFICCWLWLMPDVSAQDAPFQRGVNLTGWFQASAPEQIQFTRYTRRDFEQIKSLGCDVIRLPVNLHFMTNGSPDYIPDPLFYSFLDTVVNWCEQLNLYLIIDNHTFDPATDTDPEAGEILNKVWTQVATHCKDRSTLIMYEILNEPHGISDAEWNAIQLSAVEAIREVDSVHTIVVGPAGWNSYNNLSAMPVYSDNNLIYTFHFYDPFIFTHQGASWTDPSLEPLSGVPFPFETGAMPVLPASLNGTWVEWAFNNYMNDGTMNQVKNLLNIAINFKNQRQVPVLCGEFGVYIPNSPPDQRIAWYDSVRTLLEQNHISWTIWDYHGGFGLFRAGGNDLFEHDLNVPLLEALGLETPMQTDYKTLPDSSGFVLYDDYVGPRINSFFSTAGINQPYSVQKPNNGSYCLFWTGADQYNALEFNFTPDRDLSWLVEENYAIDFMARAQSPSLLFDIRFVDTKSSPSDRPWRMGITIDESFVPSDGRWHHVHIPLSSLSEKGAWDNAWYEPSGLFDWKLADRFEVVAEYGHMDQTLLWIDNLHITNMDTARIFESGVVVSNGQVPETPPVVVYPNPAHGCIYFSGPDNQTWQISLIDISGRECLQTEIHRGKPTDISGLRAGVYFYRIVTGDTVIHSGKLLIN